MAGKVQSMLRKSLDAAKQKPTAQKAMIKYLAAKLAS